jgi:hypothetical protein
MTERQRRVMRLAKRYAKLLGVNRWYQSVKILFDDQMEDRASCSADPEYLEAVVRFNLDRITEGEEEAFIRHELLHCLVWPLCHTSDFLAGDNAAANEMVRLANERVTSWLEHMPLWEQLE